MVPKARVNMDRSSEEIDLDRAIEIIKNGGVVVIPTETAYGLVADATNVSAVERIQSIKGRDLWKTPPLIVDSFETAEQFVELTPRLRELANQHWPGPLTIVAKAKESKLAKQVIREDGTIAVRVSSNSIAQAIARAINAPIVATSANLSGLPECYSVEGVQNQFKESSQQPDFYVDGGTLKPVAPSTIIKEEYANIIILRQGETVVT